MGKLQPGIVRSERYRVLNDIEERVNDLQLAYCGSEQCAPGHRFGPNRRECFVLHVVRSGEGRLLLNGEEFTLGEGFAFVLRAHQEAWYEADHERPWNYFWVGFSGVDAETCVRKAGFPKERPFRPVGCTEKLGEYLDEMLDAHQLNFWNSLRRNANLMLFFSELIQDYTSTQSLRQSYSYSSSSYVRYVKDYIDRYYEKKLRIGAIAEYIGVNRSYLSNSFRRETGVSPQEYLMGIRIRRAQTLLRESGFMIAEIAQQVGYPDALAFSRIFRQRVGLSPSAYRRSGPRPRL